MPSLPVNFSYIFSGEIPWSNNVKLLEELHLKESFEEELQRPYAWFNWGNSSSVLNDVGGVPVIRKEIADFLQISINPKYMSFVNNKNELATKLIWDDYSKYLYIRKDLIENYLKFQGYTLLFFEMVTKITNFRSKKFSDSKVKDFYYISCLDEL